MEQKRPRSHEKEVVSGGSGVHRRGDGLGTGPVGSQDGYAGKTPSGGHGKRAAAVGGGGTIGVLAIAFLLLKSCSGGGMTDMLGGFADPSGELPYHTEESQAQQYSVDSSVPVDNTVATGSREKRTKILGNNQDTVTMMIYLCGTDLESKSGMASADLGEIAAANYGDNVNIIVYTGGCSRWKTEGISSQVNQIYRVRNGRLELLEQNMGNKAMTNPATLTEFIQYCASNFPANRNELIFWDHGGGSVSGYGYDEKNVSSGSMSLAGINKALSNAGVKFDFIGFDACLMATAETALMLDSYADYLIASEETEPGIGWYYTNWLNKFAANTSMATVDVGKIIVDDFVSECKRRCNGQKTTLSVIDLAEFANTIPKNLTNFAKSVNGKLEKKEYQEISDARKNTREFAVSSRIDQVDLVDLANNVGTDEAKALASAIQKAVKYNRTSTNMSNCYGVSIYFPYNATGKVDSACKTYNQIGMDSEYASCIRKFASLETGGQVSAGGSTSTTSLIGTLLGGGGTSGSSGSSDLISGLLSSFLGGGRSIAGLDESNTEFMNDLDVSSATQYYAENYLDASKLVWTASGSDYTMSISKDQWAIIRSIDKNMFLDDGEGFVDLGLDELFEYKDGVLTGDMEKTWLGINGQLVAYYHTDTEKDAETGAYLYYGYIPALLNGERVKLLVEFDANGKGKVVGATTNYKNNETDTVAKDIVEIANGDKIDFLCDYYSYDYNYQDSYMLGDQITVNGDLIVTDLAITGQKAVISYRFTDMYNKAYWTDPVTK